MNRDKLIELVAAAIDAEVGHEYEAACLEFGSNQPPEIERKNAIHKAAIAAIEVYEREIGK